jgi:predicted transcriptional regulator
MKTENILIAIKPKYVKKIFSGEKKWEYRKRAPEADPKKLYIYETAPTSAIVGEVKVKRSVWDFVCDLYQNTEENSGITLEEFEKYFEGYLWGEAYELGKPIKYRKPIKIKNPPQNYHFMTEEIENNIELLQKEKPA